VPLRHIKVELSTIADSDSVQLCMRGLILEGNGYRCNEAAGTCEGRGRVRIIFHAELRS